MKKNLFIGAGVVALLVLAAAGYWYMKAGDTTTPPEDGTTVIEGGENRIEFDDTLIEKVAHPPLDRTVAFSSTLPQDARTALETNIAKLVGQLEDDSENYGAWLDLALMYKTSGDYEGAVEIWEYIAQVVPGESVSYHNLGNYYHHEVEDFVTAESYFKQAIERNPGQSIHYQALFELYRYSYKTDTNLAEETLKEGISAVGNSIDLLISLGRFYKETGRTEEAKQTYLEVRSKAEAAGNENLVQSVDAELEGLY
ncbi:MAG: hypothetical protein OQJ98_02705 [Candidatus Pacebacteria bacterium]|nr:hypothetical protein [Candidatus Paceibacterota bacterium]